MTILHEILLHKQTEVEAQKELCPLNELKKQINFDLKPISLLKALTENKKNNKTSLIAEVKKASPSKGLLIEDFNPEYIATEYEKAGATAISVLTDEKYFQGKIEYLKKIKQLVKIPVLRKDFIVDEYQIWQTRQINADIILLIASALEQNQLKDYFALSKELDLDVLLEVHDKEELDFAQEINADIIGINNRNLKTFETDLNTSIKLIRHINLENSFVISESGIFTSQDVQELRAFGIDGILVGESLIKSYDIAQAVKTLIQ